MSSKAEEKADASPTHWEDIILRSGSFDQVNIYSFSTPSTEINDIDFYGLLPIPRRPLSLTGRPNVHPRAASDYHERYRPCPGPPRTKRQHDNYVALRNAGVDPIFWVWAEAWLVIGRSNFPGAGFGLFAAADIAPSDRPVIYYSGELLTADEVKMRYKLSPHQSVYDSSSCYLAELGGQFIDASDPSLSGAARYINHQPSKLANCKLTKYGGVVPIKKIPLGTEITYCYSSRWTTFLADQAYASAEFADDE